MASPAKKLVDNILTVCDTLEDTPVGIRKDHPGFSLRKAFTLDVVQFIMYLSASDGHVTWREADYLSELMDMRLTPDDMYKISKERNVYSVEFEEKVPLSLQLFVKADKWMLSLGKKDNANLAKTVIDGFYEIVGRDFIKCDGDVDSNEVRDLNIYLGTLRDYVRRELDTGTVKATYGGNSLKSHYEKLKKTD